MKLEHGIIISVEVLACISLGLISIEPNTVPYWKALLDIKQFHDTGCNQECKTVQDAEGAICTEVTKNEFACRPPRVIFYPDREVQVRTVFPPEYGEFLYFPDGFTTDDGRLFDINKVDLINPDTKQIRIEFANHNINPPEPQFEYITTLIPGQTIVSHCTGTDRKMGHVVEYLDTFEMEGRTYIEFWGSHVKMPDSLLPCKTPEIIEHSISYDQSLGIIFEEITENEDYPFGLTGPTMNQETCNDFVISQWQPRVEYREMVQQFLEICIQRGFLTHELVERGKIADNFTMGPIQSAQTLAEGDIEKTIEILEETYRENED